MLAQSFRLKAQKDNSIKIKATSQNKLFKTRGNQGRSIDEEEKRRK